MQPLVDRSLVQAEVFRDLPKRHELVFQDGARVMLVVYVKS